MSSLNIHTIYLKFTGTHLDQCYYNKAAKIQLSTLPINYSRRKLNYHPNTYTWKEKKRPNARPELEIWELGSTG